MADIIKTVEIETNTAASSKALDLLTKSIEKLDEASDNLNKTTKEGNEDLAKSSKEADKGVKASTKGFKGLGIAIAATGIGLFVAAAKKLGEVFMKNQKVVDVVNTAFEALSIAMNDFVNFVVDNAGGIVDFFKAIFENPVESIKEFGKAVKANITERFESMLDTLGFLASAVKKVFSGDFKGALEDVKKAGKESVDVLTGVNNTVDKAKDVIDKATSAIVDYTKKTIKGAKENVELAKSAELAAVINQGLIEKYDIQAEQLRQIRDEERNSIEDRIKANNDLAKVLDDQEKAMKANAAIMVASAAAELSKNKESIELQKAYQEALNEQVAIEAQITGFRSEQKANELALDKERLELINSRLESESQLAIERQRFNAEEITNELARLQKLKEINDLEQQQEQARLQAIVDNANAGTQAKIDAQIALDEFMEQSRQTDAQLDRQVKDAKIKNAEQVSGAIGQLASVAGEGTVAGKALGVASATIDTYVGANKALAQGGFAGIAQAIAIIATGLVNVKTILSTKVPKPTVGGVSTGGGGEATPALPAPPSFNIVGATETSQLADAIGGQTQQPVQAYVVANDVTTAQSLENNIVEGATLG
jgi:chromosome segregation ATPase